MHINKQQQSILISSDEEIIIVIEQIALDDIIGLECMSKFCIESFYNSNYNKSETAAGILANRWRIIKLLTLHFTEITTT
jgi:hypothetical protein